MSPFFIQNLQAEQKRFPSHTMGSMGGTVPCLQYLKACGISYASQAATSLYSKHTGLFTAFGVIGPSSTALYTGKATIFESSLESLTYKPLLYEYA